MNTKTILGISLAAAFAISMIIPASYAAADWLTAENGTADKKGPKNYVLKVNSTNTVPEYTAELGGFAWGYADGDNDLFVIATHYSVRDAHQNPDGWHAHNVKVESGTSTDLCITDLSEFVEAGISFDDDIVKVNVADKKLSGVIAGFATGFELVPNAEGCDPVDFADKFVAIDNVLALGVNFT